MGSTLIGIAGGTGSGKTTLAHKIARRLGPDRAAIIAHDAYYLDLSHLSPAARAAVNFDEPAALDNDLLLDDLRSLKAGRPVSCPEYDFTTHTRRARACPVPAREIVVVEGILLFAVPALRDVFDVRVYVDTSADVRLARRVNRDLAERGRDRQSVEAQYFGTVLPMHQMHVEPSKRFAHIVVAEGGAVQGVIDAIVDRLGALV